MLTLPGDAAAVARLVPHAGSMSLLDRVLHWEEGRILCETARHRDPAHPLRRDGILPAICGVEFALQAMALHGALGEGAAQRRGFVSSLRDVSLRLALLDEVPGPLEVEAEALVAEASGFIYRFAIRGEGEALLEGQAAVILA
ncbi:phosphotransferase [Sabulicella rubraurantiaca]|uniref:phosphotransferase n=1 Tax=Sabulicella rubraurantiaca TaxID=2811429 RepID=UPI001A97A63A|nr:phosphotransferase [Sabulicella rubraurantiaca]